MRSTSDGGLRRWAWTLWWLQLACFISSVPLVVVTQDLDSEEWGGGGAVSGIAFGLVILAFPLVGLLILRQQPRNTIGWLLQAIGAAWMLGVVADFYATYGLVFDPGSVPAPMVVAALNEGSWILPIGLTGTFLVLLYPNGHLPSPRWRPVAWVCATTMVVGTLAIAFEPGKLEESPVPETENPLAWHAGEPLLTVVIVVVLPLLPLGIVTCAVALVRRFRRSVGVERLQLKWLAAAGAVVAFLFLLTLSATLLVEVTDLSDQGAAWLKLLQLASQLSFGLLPAAIGIAILRYGLYEIDVVIKRTLVYAFLTATLVGVYLGSVLLLQLLLSPLTEKSDFAVAGSTLAAAALFGPVRRRIQLTVDRRFYRSKYDAARTVDEFGARLRHQVDLDAVGADLRGVVHASVQPAYVTLWIRP